MLIRTIWALFIQDQYEVAAAENKSEKNSKIAAKNEHTARLDSVVKINETCLQRL